MISKNPCNGFIADRPCPKHKHCIPRDAVDGHIDPAFGAAFKSSRIIAANSSAVLTCFLDSSGSILNPLVFAIPISR
jgi:hypothetical protein